jgi:hypothetical protein
MVLFSSVFWPGDGPPLAGAAPKTQQKSQKVRKNRLKKKCPHTPNITKSPGGSSAIGQVAETKIFFFLQAAHGIFFFFAYVIFGKIFFAKTAIFGNLL